MDDSNCNSFYADHCVSHAWMRWEQFWEANEALMDHVSYEEERSLMDEAAKIENELHSSIEGFYKYIASAPHDHPLEKTPQQPPIQQEPVATPQDSPLKEEPEDGEDGEDGSGEEGSDDEEEVDDEEEASTRDDDDDVVASTTEEDCVSVPCVPVVEPITVIVDAPDTPSGCGTTSPSALTVIESRPPGEPLPATLPEVPSGPGPPIRTTLDAQTPVGGSVQPTSRMPTVFVLGISQGPGPPCWMLGNQWPVGELATRDALDTPSRCGTPPWIPALVPDVPPGPGPPLSITLDGQAPVGGFVQPTSRMPTVLVLGISRGPGPPCWMLYNPWPISERATRDAPVHGAPPWIALEHC